MITSAEWLQIARLIREQLNVILSGQTAATQVENTVGTESIDSLVPGAPTIEKRPVAHPYGLVSRAPNGTTQVTARQGDHPANRIVLLHRDTNRPSLDAEGDVCLYDAHGNQVKLVAGKMVMKLAGTLELGEGAMKGAARVNDPVVVHLTAALIASLGLVAGTNPVTAAAVPVPQDATGEITAGSAHVKIVD